MQMLTDYFAGGREVYQTHPDGDTEAACNRETRQNDQLTSAFAEVQETITHSVATEALAVFNQYFISR